MSGLPDPTGGLDFALPPFADWLAGFLGRPLGDISIRPTQGGMSNPTYFVKSGDFRAVLRKQPGMKLAKSAHAIDREYRVIGALADTDVPVPELFHYETDAGIIGTPFYLMEWVEGRVITEYGMEDVAAPDRRAHFLAMVETLATLHNLAIAELGLSDYGRPGNYFRRQHSVWSGLWGQYRDGPGAPVAEIDALINWLEPRVPESELLRLCHGDFRIGNIMYHPTEPRLVAVLDWELSTLGNPLVDLGFNTQAWHMPPDANGGILGLDLAALGIPEEDDYLAHYYARVTHGEAMQDVHRVFAMFRGAVGAAGVAIRGQLGNSTLPDSERVGWHLARAYAARGLAIAEGGAG